MLQYLPFVLLLFAVAYSYWDISRLPHLPARWTLSPKKPAQLCCERLEDALPTCVSYPGHPAYEKRQRTFYAASQRELQPSCRVSPRNASEVSIAIQTAVQNECTFAVVSGGHMNWDASNIGAEGFSLDLAELNDITIPSDGSESVHVGAGNRWARVFEYLGDRGLAAVGGRSKDVGVSGFLLGGGISFLSWEHGWGASNILAYQIVLSNGTIVDATPYQNNDLFKSLRFGSTNYGIVTRFTLKTFPSGDIWGGSRVHTAEYARPLLDNLITLPATFQRDPRAGSAVGLIWNSALNAYLTYAPLISTAGPEEWPTGFKGLQSIGPTIMDTTRQTNYLDIATEFDSGFQGGKRTLWFSMTFKANAQLGEDIFEKGKQLFAPFLGRVAGFEWLAMYQIVPVGMILASHRHGGDFSGLRESDGDHWVMLGSVFWDSPSDDVVLKGALNRFEGWCQGVAAERGLLIRFIYPNYAGPDQDVINSFGSENVAAMKEVQKRYDPDLLIPRYWRGGYRLP